MSSRKLCTLIWSMTSPPSTPTILAESIRRTADDSYLQTPHSTPEADVKVRHTWHWCSDHLTWRELDPPNYFPLVLYWLGKICQTQTGSSLPMSPENGKRVFWCDTRSPWLSSRDLHCACLLRECTSVTDDPCRPHSRKQSLQSRGLVNRPIKGQAMSFQVTDMMILA